MTPQRRQTILVADDGTQPARAAVESYQAISLSLKSRILVISVIHSGQIPRFSGTCHDSKCTVLLMKQSTKE
jgi:hypothetical protein